MKIGAFVGVKDEVELIAKAIDHLHTIGVDTIIVCDMNSTDGTREALRARQSRGNIQLILGDDAAPEGRDWFAAARDTASRLAAMQYDWILFLDADEFWIPLTGRLSDCASLPDLDIISVPRYNIPLVRGESWEAIRFDPSGYDRLLAVAKPAADFRPRNNPDASWIMGVPGPKVMARPQFVASVIMGAHDVVSPAGMTPRRGQAQDLFIAHLPFTTKERFARKIANIREIARHHETNDPNLGWHWRRWLENIDKNGIDHEFEKNVVDEGRRDALRRDGVIVSASDIFRRDSVSAESHAKSEEPAPPSDGGASKRDVVCCYHVLHGREPESSEIIAEKMMESVPRLVAGGLVSDEFRSGVILAIAHGELPPHARMSRKPEPVDLEWAAKNLPLEPDARPRLAVLRSWRELFTTLFNDEAFRRAVPALRADPALADAILDMTSRLDWVGKKAIVGAIEVCLEAELTGWAANQADLDERVTLEILADGQPVGVARCDRFRPDLMQALGEEGNFGFQFTFPASLRQSRPRGFYVSAVEFESREPISGERYVDLSRVPALGALEELNRRLSEIEAALRSIRAQIPSASLLTSYSLNSYDEYARDAGAIGEFRRVRQQAEALTLKYRPLVSIMLRTSDSAPEQLEDSLRSIVRQTYDRWELLVCSDSSDNLSETRQTVDRAFSGDVRVKFVPGGEGGLAARCNRGLAAATGEYLCFLEAGDELSDDALFSVVQTLQTRRHRLLYSDEDRLSVDESGRRFFHSVYFKPDFDWDLLIGQNYLCRLMVAETALVRGIGGFRPEYDGTQDYDLVLRCLDQVRTEDVRHVCRVLYHWRMAAEANSDSQALDRSETHRLACVNDHLRRSRIQARAAPLVDSFAGPRKGGIGLKWALPEDAPPVSIIIPTRDRADLLRRCLAALRPAIDAYRGPCEIFVVDNGSTESDARALIDSLATPDVRVMSFEQPFNWSVINNEAVRAASGAVLLFLNNDAFMKDSTVLSRLVAQAMRPDVGAVGARLLYEDNVIQHAGILLGVDGHSAHDGAGLHAADPGYFGRYHLARQASAVTGACLATRRAVFDEVGGFDPSFALTCNDSDYCLRIGERGYKTIYDPAIMLYHLESRTRAGSAAGVAADQQSNEEMRFRSRWSARVARDPFYNPHFERHCPPFTRIRLVDHTAEGRML